MNSGNLGDQSIHKLGLKTAALVCCVALLSTGCSSMFVGTGDSITFTAPNCKPRELQCVLTAGNGREWIFTPPHTLAVERRHLRRLVLSCKAGTGAQYTDPRFPLGTHFGAMVIDMLIWNPILAALIAPAAGAWTDPPAAYRIPLDCAAGEMMVADPKARLWEVAKETAPEASRSVKQRRGK